MRHLSRALSILAAVSAIAALTGSFEPTSASAQTPATVSQGCAAMAPPRLPAPPSDAQVGQWQAQFAQALAQNLDLQLPVVQQAISSTSADLVDQASPSQAPPAADPITATASQLDVTFGSLLSAVQSTDQALFCAGAPVSPDSFYAAVAQTLGQGLTAQQVESAFAATAPPPPDPSLIQAGLQNRLSALAAALGVSPDALTSALKAMAASGSCMPPNVLDGFRLPPNPAGMQQPPPTDGPAPLLIPLTGVVGAPPAPPSGPPDPLGVGMLPCGIGPS
jgi:hypothetical protein